MKSNTNTIMIDNYYGLMRGLSKDFKIKIIEKLSNSIVDEVSENEHLADRFYGAFKSNKSAEDIITEIKDSRAFNRTVEAF